MEEVDEPCQVCDTLGLDRTADHNFRVDPRSVLPTQTASVLSFILTTNHVSFVQITNQFPFAQGDSIWCMGRSGKAYLWRNLSWDIIHILCYLVHTDQIVATPCSAAVYALDGIFPREPIISNDDMKNPIAVEALTELHWFPVVFSNPH